MVRPTYVDTNGIKKGAWTEEEDNKLRAYIQDYGHSNWRLLPKYAGLERCGKSCRLRWLNYLKPGTKHGNFTREEEELLIQLHHQLGNKWSAIASRLPGRTDNEVKNFWHTNIKKRNRKPTVINNPSTEQDQYSYKATEQDENPSTDHDVQITFDMNSFTSYHHHHEPASLNDFLFESFNTDTDYSQMSGFGDFPPLLIQDDALLFQHEAYCGEYSSFPCFSSSDQAGVGWNNHLNVVDEGSTCSSSTGIGSSQPYFSSQLIEETGDIYDHPFQLFDTRFDFL